MKQAEREGKIEAWFRNFELAGRTQSARDFLEQASNDFWSAVADFSRGEGWAFVRELVELVEEGRRGVPDLAAARSGSGF